jgi:hypothetical protein
LMQSNYSISFQNQFMLHFLSKRNHLCKHKCVGRIIIKQMLHNLLCSRNKQVIFKDLSIKGINQM